MHLSIIQREIVKPSESVSCVTVIGHFTTPLSTDPEFIQHVKREEGGGVPQEVEPLLYFLDMAVATPGPHCLRVKLGLFRCTWKPIPLRHRKKLPPLQINQAINR